LLNRVTSLEIELRSKRQFAEIIGHDKKMVQIFKLIDKIANSDVTVLIQGESGTGKDLIARSIHENSNRRDKLFVPINCGAFPEHLLESELFGYEKGAFTGAYKDKPGWFEVADGGTIFLDEISAMSLNLQVKLLRILQSGEFFRLGSTEIRHCDVRVIAATNKDLSKLMQDGKFREDLYFRLDVVNFEVPPLRDRRCDILPLIQHFLKKYNKKEKKSVKGLSQDAEALLLVYDFPGNVRELENIIHRGITLAETDRIELSDLPESLKQTGENLISPEKHSSLTEAKRHAAENAEKQFIINSLKRTSGHISNPAKLAGIDVSNFHKLMNKHGIDPNGFKFS